LFAYSDTLRFDLREISESKRGLGEGFLRSQSLPFVGSRLHPDVKFQFFFDFTFECRSIKAFK
jgi:hypothetical protein